MKPHTSQFDRGDGSIQNFIRMLRPILEEKELIGIRITATELAKICRNHHRRLPVRTRRAIELVEELKSGGWGNIFRLGDLDISVYRDGDPDTRNRSHIIEFQLAVGLEQQYLDEPGQKELENAA